MRCACYVCGTYMVHSEGLALGCVCPECGARCKACLGTDTVVSREHLKDLGRDSALMREIMDDLQDNDEGRP